MHCSFVLTWLSQDKSTPLCHQETELVVLPCLKKKRKKACEMPLLSVKWHISCCHCWQVWVTTITLQLVQPAVKPSSIRGSLPQRCSHNLICLVRGIMFFARDTSQQAVILGNCPEKHLSLSDLASFYSTDTINQPSHSQLIAVFFLITLRSYQAFSVILSP